MKKLIVSILFTASSICTVCSQADTTKTGTVPPIKSNTQGGSSNSAKSGSSEWLVPDMPQQNTRPILIPQETTQPVPAYNDKDYQLSGFKSREYDDLDAIGLLKSRKRAKIWNRDISGFRGFLDQGYTVGIGANANQRYEFSVSFGYQFNPLFYLGLAQSYFVSFNEESSLPTALNFRVNLFDEYTTPFIDLKGGYSFLEGKGAYFNPSVGYSFSKNNKRSLNLSVGYSFQRVTKIGGHNIPADFKYHGISLRLTYEYTF